MTGVLGLINGNVLTLESGFPVCEALLIEDQTIVARGTSAMIEELCMARQGQLLDLAGRTVLPGFHDCHVHLLGVGFNAGGIDLYECRSVAEVLDRVRAAAQSYPPERWIFGQRLDESRLQEKRPPTAAELDRAAPQHSVYLVDRGLHYTLVNTAARDRLGLAPDLPGLGQEPDGSFSGRLHGQANRQAKKIFFDRQDPAELAGAIRLTAEMAAKAGLTTVHACEGGTLFSDSYLPLLLEIQEELPVNVVVHWSIEDVAPIKEAGLRQGKDILLDGSIGSRTAAFVEPYADDPSTTGELYYSDQQVEQMISQAHLSGVQITLHAIGERAISQALDCFEKVLRQHPHSDHRHALDHFGFPQAADIERAARLGLVISTQPAFMYLRGGPDQVYTERLGPARAARGYPLRRFLEAGLMVGGGSDADVTPMDPLLGLQAAVNQPYPQSSVSLAEAIRMYTIEAARLTFAEGIRGTIEEGKQADLTVLTQDPFLVPATALRDIEVVMTMKGGEITYQKDAPADVGRGF